MNNSHSNMHLLRVMTWIDDQVTAKPASQEPVVAELPKEHDSALSDYGVLVGF